MTMHAHDTTEEDEIYRENILDHNAHPRNKGHLADATYSEHSLNPSCGDRFTIHVKLDGEKVGQIAFEGVGCAVSTASMSMFSEAVEGMSLEEFRGLNKQYVFDLLGVPISAAREKCALVSIKTAHEGLAKHEA